MKLFLLTFFVFTATDFCSGCISRSPYSFERIPSTSPTPTTPSNLIFSTGDVIICDIQYRNYTESPHVLLATSSNTLIHATGPRTGGPSNETRIVEEDARVVSSSYSQCKVATAFYDKTYASICEERRRESTPISTSEILRRANASRNYLRGKTTMFHWVKCNSENWVTAWRYGSSWNRKPMIFTSRFRLSDCEAPGKRECF